MVSVHDTDKYNNYIYNLPTQKDEIVENTLYHYLQIHHPTANIDDYTIKNKLITVGVYHTIFLQTGITNNDNLLEYTYAHKLKENLSNYFLNTPTNKQISVNDDNIQINNKGIIE